MSLEQTLEEFKVPEHLNANWLTREYIKEKGWYPVCDEWLKKWPDGVTDTSFGQIPWRTRSEFKPGDIIIFNEFEERIVNGKYETDRFLRVRKGDIDDYQCGERDLLPNGIVVHPPSGKIL